MTPSIPTPPADPPADPSPAGVLDRSLALVRFLRANCEWDAAQTPTSLVPYLLDEAREVADAAAADDAGELADELGDLLLNVAFQIVIAEERRAFSATDVVHALESKMRRRHPHLYGDGPRVEWAELKKRERDGVGVGEREREQRAGSLLDDLAAAADPLTAAQRVQERVATVGFDWADWRGALEKVVEETGEVRALLEPVPEGAERDPAHDDIEGEIGDLLFAVVNLARLSGVDATGALRRANAKFSGRFRELETLAAERSVVVGEASLAELDRLWDEVKAARRRNG